MADAQRTIDLIFRGVDQTGAAVDSVLRNTGNFATGVQSATQPIADFTVGALKLEAGLLAAGAAFTTVAVIAAGEFDTAFREISTLVDAPADALNALRTELLDYANGSTQSLEQITQATYSAISAGVDYTDSVETLAAAEQLAVAGRADLNDSMVLLVSSLNAYGAEMDEAARYSDILFTTVRLGQTTLPELAASLSNVTGTAATLGVPFETLTAALAALTTVGIPTAQATTSLNAALSAMIAPSSEAKTVAQQLGIEFSAQAVRAQGLEGVLQTVLEATGGNEEQMRRLFGSTEALRAVLPLTGAAAESFAANLVAMQNNSGSTAAAFELMSQSIGLIMQRVSNSFNGLLINIGTPLLDSLGGVADAIASIFTSAGLSVQDGALAEMVEFVKSQMEALEAVFLRVAQNLPAALEQADLSGFTDGILAINRAFGQLFSGIDITSVDGLASAITLAGNAFQGLSLFVGGVITSFQPMFQYFVDLSQNLNTTNPKIFEAAGHFSGLALQANVLAGALTGLLPTVEALLNVLILRGGFGILGALGSTTAAAVALSGALGSAALLAGIGALTYALAGRTGVAGALDDVISSATGAETTLGGLIYEFVNGAEEAEIMAEALRPIPRAMEDIARAAERVDMSSILIPADQLTRDASAIAVITREYQALGQSALEAAIPAGFLTEAMTEQQAAIDSLLIPQDLLTRSTANFAETTSGIIPIYDAATGAIIGYENGIIAAGSAEERANQAIQDRLGNINIMTGATQRATAATAEMAAVSAEFAQEFAIETLRSSTEIRVAEIEAGARRIEAAFDSINVSIESTGDLIGTALNLLADQDTDLRGRFDVERQLGIENERRGDALSLQEDLTRAQIRATEAQAASLERGDGIITIQGDGLAPHLEAMMFEVFRSIQVRVNQDGLGLLLGSTP